MILLTITIEENESILRSQGIVSGFRATELEEELADGLLKAIEKHCTNNRAVDGSLFIRRELPKRG